MGKRTRTLSIVALAAALAGGTVQASEGRIEAAKPGAPKKASAAKSSKTGQEDKQSPAPSADPVLCLPTPAPQASFAPGVNTLEDIFAPVAPEAVRLAAADKGKKAPEAPGEAGVAWTEVEPPRP